jgi:hypothetical protein
MNDSVVFQEKDRCNARLAEDRFLALTARSKEQTSKVAFGST